jgi:hypothetical protein
VGKPVAIYLQNQVGGNYHTVFAVAKNTSGDDLSVSAQFSFLVGKRLLGTADATTTLLAGQEGVLIADAVDLPKPFRAGTVTVTTDTSEPFIDDALRNPSAITVTAPSIEPDTSGFGYCEFRAVVTNETAETQSSVRVSWVGYSNGRPVTTAYTAYEKFFPKTPKVVTDSAVSEAVCPPGVTKVRAFWSP